MSAPARMSPKQHDLCHNYSCISSYRMSSTRTKCYTTNLHFCMTWKIATRPEMVKQLGNQVCGLTHLDPLFYVLIGLFCWCWMTVYATTVGLTFGLYRSGPYFFIIFVDLRFLNVLIGTVYGDSGRTVDLWHFGMEIVLMFTFTNLQ